MAAKKKAPSPKSGRTQPVGRPARQVAGKLISEKLFDDEELPVSTSGVKSLLNDILLPSGTDRERLAEEILRRLQVRHALALQPLESLKRWQRVATASDALNKLLMDPTLHSVIGEMPAFHFGGRSLTPWEAAAIANLFLGALPVIIEGAITKAKEFRGGEFFKANPKTLALFLIATLDIANPSLGLKAIGTPDISREVFLALKGDPSTFYKYRKQLIATIRSGRSKRR